MMEENRRLYLQIGDRVIHLRFPEWGSGVVVEERNSQIAGGASYVRITFGDGHTRAFDNNFANPCCCYHSGIRRC